MMLLHLGFVEKPMSRGLARQVTAPPLRAHRVLHQSASRPDQHRIQCGAVWRQSKRAKFSQTFAGESGEHGAADVPNRIAIFVEPTPFTYICGYKNRFMNLIKYLRAEGREVLVLTTGKGVTWPFADRSAFVEQPEEYFGAKVVSAFSFGLPFYWSMPLTLALSPRIWKAVKEFDPELIHVSSPGVMVLAARLMTSYLKIPLVMSYHTHIPKYLPNYNLGLLVGACWALVRALHGAAHLTLATSPNLMQELQEHCVSQQHVGIEVWKKGVDSDTFHPQYRSPAMRARMTDGHPEDPLLVYVGRLGTEKNLGFVKHYLDRFPSARLAFVGDGPARAELEEVFAGTRTVFLGMLTGRDLSEAYSSADVFVMPSESETLGFVVLEAMASGLPVVAVRAGGIPDILCNAPRTGFLYDSGDVESACSYLHPLLEDSGLREQVGVAARAEVSNWDWQASTHHVLYEQYARATTAARRQYGARFRRGSAAQQGVDWDAPGGQVQLAT